MKTITPFNFPKTLLVLSVCVLAFSAQAQTAFSISPSSGSITETVDCDSSKEMHFTIIKPAVSMNLSYKVTVNSLPYFKDNDTASCWVLPFCDWKHCAGVPAIGVVVTNNAMDTQVNLDIHLAPKPKKIKGVGKVEIQIYETAFPSNSKTLTWNVTGCTTGSECTVNTPEYNANNLFDVYPVPTHNSITLQRISANNIAIGTVQIFNVMGEVVMQENATNSSVLKIDVSSLPVGVYYIKRNNPMEGVMVKQFLKVN